MSDLHPAYHTASGVACMMRKVPIGDTFIWQRHRKATEAEEGAFWNFYRPEMPCEIVDGYKIFENLQLFNGAAAAPATASVQVFDHGQLIEAHGEGHDRRSAQQAAQNNAQLQMGCGGPTH